MCNQPPLKKFERKTMTVFSTIHRSLVEYTKNKRSPKILILMAEMLVFYGKSFACNLFCERHKQYQ